MRRFKFGKITQNPFRTTALLLNETNFLYSLLDEIINKEKGIYTFPSQFGYNISEEASLKFEIQTTRKYVLQFESGVEGTNNLTTSLIDGVESYVKLKKSNKDNDDLLHIGFLENPQNYLTIDSEKAILKVKRNNLWSVNVTYKLDKYLGDCNFDESICDYKKDTDEYFILEHKLKNEWKSNIDEETNFYLAITKPIGSDVKRAVVYTPPVIERNFTQLKATNRELYNKKVYSLSFSFKPGKSTDRLEVFLKTNRSEMYLNRNTDEIQFIKRFSINDGEKVGQKSDASACNSNSLSSSVENWYRMKSILLYSCYDFQLGFAALYGQENNFTETVSTVAIDDVNIDFRLSTFFNKVLKLNFIRIVIFY
jgi:hypothetical protein